MKVTRAERRPLVWAIVALVLAAVFGGAVQYLGSLSAHPWATEVSLLSAPWLLLPFLAGWTQQNPRSAALLGLACTVSGLVGYGLMTLSPIENAEYSVATVTGFVRSEARVFIGGLVTGPLFGWFGFRWREDRAWFGALLTAAALLLEPAALLLVDREIDYRAVWIAEIAVGVVLAIYVVTAVVGARARGLRAAT